MSSVAMQEDYSDMQLIIDSMTALLRNEEIKKYHSKTAAIFNRELIKVLTTFKIDKHIID